jgi:DNA-directed RNA polymerase subunit M/transcription elongation factor TFIIS
VWIDSSHDTTATAVYNRIVSDTTTSIPVERLHPGRTEAMQIEFECVVCGRSAAATVADKQAGSDDEPLKTTRECPDCGIETIWIES